MTIGVFGGTFDPPHIGHMEVANNVLASGLVDSVWWTVNFAHAFNKNSASFEDRCTMVLLAIKNYDGMIMWDIEQFVENPQWTENVLEVTYKILNEDLRFIIGTSQYGELNNWHDFNAVKKIAPPIWVSRNGIIIPESPIVDCNIKLSSTEIRNKIKSEISIKGLVRKNVENYIKNKGLYKE